MGLVNSRPLMESLHSKQALHQRIPGVHNHQCPISFTLVNPTQQVLMGTLGKLEPYSNQDLAGQSWSGPCLQLEDKRKALGSLKTVLSEREFGTSSGDLRGMVKHHRHHHCDGGDQPGEECDSHDWYRQEVGGRQEGSWLDKLSSGRGAYWRRRAWVPPSASNLRTSWEGL